MKKKEFIRENIEAEGYTLRVEEGVTYIEKEEKINHFNYGECFSFFQQKIELDIKGEEIVTQKNRLYKKSENKEQNLKSEELIFNGKEEPIFITTYDYYDSGNIIREFDKENGIEKRKYYDKSGCIMSIEEVDEVNGIKNIKKYNEFGGITYMKEVDKVNGIDQTIYYEESGDISYKYVTKFDKENEIKQKIYYDSSGDITHVYEKDEKTGESTNSRYHYDRNGNLDYKTIITINKDNEEIDRKYSRKRGNVTKEYGDNKHYHPIYYPEKYKHIRTIEDLENGGRKITEDDTVTYEYKNKKIICTYKNNTICQKIIERERERIVVKFNIHGDWTSILRNNQNSNVPIEEFYKKGELFPVFKVEGLEIPLDSLDKYKDVCKKYNIEELSEVLEAHKPKKTIESTIKSLVDYFKR